MVTPEMIAESTACGPDPEPIVNSVKDAVEAGVDHVYFHQIGDDQEGFCRFWEKELAPALTDLK